MQQLQGADRVNEELEVGYDQRFEQGWQRAEQAGRVVMVVFVAAGLAGLMGRGPYSHDTAKSPESGLAVDFEPVARSQTATQVTLHVSNLTSDPTRDIFIGTNAVEPMGLQRILPQPIATKAVQDGMVLTIPVPPGTKDAKIRLMLEPSTIGSNELVAQLAGAAPIRWTQFVVP